MPANRSFAGMARSYTYAAFKQLEFTIQNSSYPAQKPL